MSQPLFYLVALGPVSGELSALAYVELRQRINAVMNVRHVAINTRMDDWSPADVPADWETHRARWTAAFATRQVVLAVADAALLVGVVAGRTGLQSVRRCHKLSESLTSWPMNSEADWNRIARREQSDS